VKVAVVHADGSPIEGFGLDDCEPAKGDSVSQTVSWAGGRELTELAGTPVRLVVQLQDAKLFALQFNQ